MEQELFEGLHKNRRWALEAVCQENLCRSWYLSYQLAGDAAGAASLLLSAWREALAALKNAKEAPGEDFQGLLLTDAPLCGYIKRVWRPRCRPWEEKRMEQKTLLITGFEPFQQETINPSWEAVALLPETIGPWRLEKLRLPVVFGKAADLAIARAQQLCPQAILAVGQAGGRGAVTPELVAINTRDAAIPDNEGNAFQGQPVVPGGGDGYFATAPVRQMVQAGPMCAMTCSTGCSTSTGAPGCWWISSTCPSCRSRPKTASPAWPWRTWPGLWRHLSWPWSRKPRPFDRMHLLSPPQM